MIIKSGTAAPATVPVSETTVIDAEPVTEISAVIEETADEFPVTDEMAAATLGDPCELAEMAVDLLTETHNLTLAFARFEHATYLSESAFEQSLPGGALTEAEAAEKKAGFISQKVGAVIEFIKRQGATLKAFWEKVKAWLLAAVETVMVKIFGPRESWLSKNMAALQAAKEFGGVHAPAVGDALARNRFAEMFGYVKETCDELMSAANDAKAEESTDGFATRLRAAYKGFLGQREEAKSEAATLEAACIGAVESVAITPELVNQMLAVAKATFANVEKMKGMRMVADGGIRMAQGFVTAGDAEAADKHAKIKALSTVGPKISTLIGSSIAVNSRGNGMAMAVLVQAVRASEANAKTPENKPAVSGDMNESASILDAYR
jgi:hypothetical protein